MNSNIYAIFTSVLNENHEHFSEVMVDVDDNQSALYVLNWLLGLGYMTLHKICCEKQLGELWYEKK